MNPLRDGLRLPQTPDPCTLVVFGASGDLARRKLLPALYALAAERQLPGGFTLLGVARSPLNDEEFRNRMRSGVEEFSRLPFQASEWEPFAAGMFYLAADYDRPESFERLKSLLERLAVERGTGGNVLFYVATPPSAFPIVIGALGEAGLARSGPERWSRIVIEKPFGHDLAGARALNRLLDDTFGEEQSYRIDHYLGKETVQNILVFRFANGIFEPVWNRRYVDHVQITVAESIGVEDRGSYYEESGALRDMLQNHLMQLLALVAMEPPSSFEPRALREEKVKLVRAIRPIDAGELDRHAARGQYGPGSIAGKPVPGYRQEKGVAAGSPTETFAALRLYADNWRWSGVPFYLRSGKRLPRRVSEIAVRFRRPPLPLFRAAGGSPDGGVSPNVLAFRLQPDDGISLKFEAKAPGQQLVVRSVNMEFRYGASFGDDVPEAYETLLLDAMQGDTTHYASGEMLETSWALVEPVLDAWKAAPPQGWPNYEAGSWGPPEAEALFGKTSFGKDAQKKGRAWRRP